MKRPAISEWDRWVIRQYSEHPEKFNSEPLSVYRYNLAHACRNLKRAIMKEWPFKLIFK